MSITISQFYDMLAKHDWYYPFSDDITAYIKGFNRERALSDIASTSPELKNLYVAFEDHYFSGPAFSTARIDKPARPGDTK